MIFPPGLLRKPGDIFRVYGRIHKNDFTERSYFGGAIRDISLHSRGKRGILSGKCVKRRSWVNPEASFFHAKNRKDDIYG